jgi:peptidoglycan L-alanyl-D-glutamate endopeptidase CwlK
MRTLKQGSQGSDVKQLQQRLNELGFPCGTADGKFGMNTRSAVSSFQRSRGLVADGIAGPATLHALNLINHNDFISGVSVISQVTVDLTARLFPGAPRSNIEQHLPFVLRGLEETELVDKPMVLMALATIRAETGSFRPIDEGVSKYNTTLPGPPFFDKYDWRTDLGNQGPFDGENFKGRGFIQLTGRDNYRRYGQRIGFGNQLVENPLLANSPQIAALLLATFLKDKELKIREALLQNRLDTARKLVNGGTYGLPEFEKAYRLGAQLIQ